MKQLTCQECNRTLPMNDLLVVRGHLVCKTCLEDFLYDKFPDGIPQGVALRQFDPTVCAKCGRDGGATEFPTVARIPLCDTCIQKHRKYPVPAWVKTFLLVLVLLGGIEFARNWRLLEAYFEMSASLKAYVAGDMSRADQLMARAADHLPEYPELTGEEKFLHAVMILQDRAPADSQDVFVRSCRNMLETRPFNWEDHGR